MIEVDDIVKRYGATIAVNHVSFRVDSGEILGFLGPNGAGKSTTLKILTCYICADSGRVAINGHDVLEDSMEVRRQIGYLPENTPLYSDMRVEEYLRFVAKVRQVPSAQLRESIDRVVEQVEIKRMLRKNIGHLSKGYRQRVGLAQALIHDPPVLILDEPTGGLDPHQIIEIRELLRELGKTKVVLFSSHILQEISAICSRIIIINDGRLVANGKPEDLERQLAEREVLRAVIHGPSEQVRAAIAAIDGVDDVELLTAQDARADVRVRARKGVDVGPLVFDAVKEKGWRLSSMQSESRSLEEVYLQLTRRERLAS